MQSTRERKVPEGEDRMPPGLRDLLRYTHATAIGGDLLKIRAREVGLGDMALVEMPDGSQSPAQAIQLDGDEVSLQVFGGGKGLSTQATVRFLGHPTQVTYSPNILGRVFRGDGQPMDGGPDLSGDRQVDTSGPSVNPATRIMPTKMIRTNVPMIDVFNCLVESQKIPIFSVALQPAARAHRHSGRRGHHRVRWIGVDLRRLLFLSHHLRG
jgi:V/A-type H+/Na+-transporting ATPase subunit B